MLNIPNIDVNMKCLGLCFWVKYWKYGYKSGSFQLRIPCVYMLPSGDNQIFVKKYFSYVLIMPYTSWPACEKMKKINSAYSGRYKI